MKKFRKILLSALSLVLVVALTIVGTVAFLQDEDGEVNVMTVGNVYIEQLEQQFGANGLEEFVQKKNLYPVPDTTLDTEAFQSTVVPAPAVNVVDKLVSVNNYGKSDAFVRTVFAFEMGTLSVDQFKNVFVYRINNTDWTWEEIGISNINGAKYFVVVATHNEIVEAKTTTDYSLTQVFLKSFAGNEECEAIDGNGNGTFDILTMSQAVQTVGFNDADTALNAAFGDVTNTQTPWSDGAEYKVSTPEQLKVALSVGGTVILEDNISLESALTVPEGIIATLDLNNYTISVPSGNAILNKGVLTLINGTVATDNGYAVNNAGSIVVSNANLTNLYNAGEATLNNTNIANTISGRHGVYHGGSALTVNGGVYSSTSGNELIRSNTSNAVINGGTFTQLGKSYLFHNVVINGGTFNGYVNENGSVDTMRNNVIVNGGTFNFDPTSFAAHKELVVKGDNTWTVYPINDTWDGTADTSWHNAGRAVTTEYKLYTAEHLAGLAKLVNDGASFANSTITLMVNVDLQNKAWTPIGVSKGFVGGSNSAIYATFDGNGKTVSNLNVDVKANAGLFGAATYAIIKNVNIKNATVVSNHFAGAVLAQGYARVENCTVENANVAVTPELIDGEWDNGDKVGGVVGKISESNNGSTIYGVYNCTIKNSTVKAYRDVAGILGFAGSYCYVQDNNVVNTTVSQDLTHDYKNFGAKNPSANVSAVVGDSTRQPGVTVKNNTYNGIICVSTAKQLADVVAAGITNVWLADGEYNVYDCGGKNLTINGSKNAVIKLYNEGEDGCDYGFGGNGTGVAHVTFNGVTIDTTANTGSYKGFAYMKGTFNDCNFVGAYSLNNANDFVFNRCTFDFKNGYFWTWGANSVTFNGCVFNGNSKTILAHGYASTVINVNNCTFAATEKGYTGAGDNTAAIEIDPAGNNTYTINFTGENTITDSYAGLTRVKDGSTGHKFVEPTVVEKVTDLDKANKGENIELNGNLNFNASETASNGGYSATGVTVAGGVLDGKGNSLGVNNWDTWDCAVNTNGGTIQNITINSGMRGIFVCGANDDIYIDNVVIDGTIYTFNSDDGNKNYGVYISNSTLNGWTSYSNAHKEVVFTNCNFGEGQGYAFCRPYNASVFENCVFEEGFEFDTSKTSDIVFINCYYGDTLITDDNAASLGMFYNGLNGITIR